MLLQRRIFYSIPFILFISNINRHNTQELALYVIVLSI